MMSSSESKNKTLFLFLPKIINGALAGVIGQGTTFPLDLVKTRLQNQQIGPKGELQYKSMFDCFMKTYKAEGFLRMYKGSAVTVLLVTPEKAIKLASNDVFRYCLTPPGGEISILGAGIAGFLAAACQVFVTTPLDLLKIQMQDAGRLEEEAKAEGRTTKHLTARQVALEIFKEKGFLGFYKGFGATFWKMTGFSAIYFPLFYELNDLGPRKSDESGEATFYWTLFAGFMAGAIVAVIMTPADVVQTRLQLIKKGKNERTYNGVADALINIFKHEGVMAFYKGANCRIVTVGSIAGIMQMVYFLGVGEYILGTEHYKI